MYQSPLYHHRNQNETFGLLPVRLIFVRQAAESNEQYQPPLQVDKEKHGQKRLETLRDKKRVKIEKILKGYNKKYSRRWERLWNRDKDKKPYLEKLNTNLDKPEEVVAQIDRILRSPFLHEDKWRSLLDEDIPMEYGRQRDDLLKMRKVVTSSKTIEGGMARGVITVNTHLVGQWNDICDKLDLDDDTKLDNSALPDHTASTADRIAAYLAMEDTMEEAMYSVDRESRDYRELMLIKSTVKLQRTLLEDEVDVPGVGISYSDLADRMDDHMDNAAEHYGGPLVDRYDRLVEMAEKEVGWEKQDAYKQIRKSFDDATKTPVMSAGRDEFKEFWTDPITGVSTNTQRESEQLFLAIIATETNDFKTDFVMGHFTNDYKENQKKYPFIYFEWLKEKGVDVQGLTEQDREVERLRSDLKGVPSAEQIIQDNPEAGTTTGKLDAVEAKYKTKKNREYWSERESALNDAKYEMNQKASLLEDEGKNGERFKKAGRQIALHEELAKQEKVRWHFLKNNKEQEVDLDFTRTKLEHPANRQILVEIAMRRFKKAMNVVDQPTDKHGDWREMYHPTVRRLLIATVYDAGVSRIKQNTETGGAEFDEDLNHEHYWLLTQISKSSYFNSQEIGQYMDNKHRKLLVVGLMANKVDEDLKYSDAALKVLNAVKKLKEDHPDKNSDAYKKAHQDLRKIYPAKMVDKAMGGTLAKIDERISEIEEMKPDKEEFIVRAANAIQNPYDKEKNYTPDTVAFLADIDAGKYSNIITKAEMDAFNLQMKAVEFNYNTLDREDVSRMDFMENLGIDIRGTYEAYLKLLKDNPDMHVGNWEDHRSSRDRAKFMKLHAFLGKIVQSNKAGGKENFLRVFETLHDHTPISDPKQDREQFIALAIYRGLATEMHEREMAYSESDRQGKEIESKLKGLHLGDKFSKFFRKLTGTLQHGSIAEKGAVIIAFAALYKLAKHGLKGNDKFSWLIKIGAGAVATDILMTKIYGKGLFDMGGIDSLQGAMEGTFEAVLVDRGRAAMENQKIEDSEHAAALYEMNKVPFHQLMDWYKHTDSNGTPLEGFTAKLPKGINLRRIARGTKWKEVDKDLKAKRIIKATMKNFFDYVATENKGISSANEAAKVLDERWVKMLDPTYKAEHTELFPRELLESVGKDQSKITWQMVMRSEIDLTHVKETKDKNGWTEIYDYWAEIGGKFVRWTRHDVFNGGLAGHIEKFAKDHSLVPGMVKEFIADMGEKGAMNLHFTAEGIGIWYDNNQWEIKRFRDDIWELIKVGAKTPFEILYGSLKMAVPWTLAKVNQIRESFRLDKVQTIHEDLNASHIISDTSMFNNSFDLFDIKNKNPEYTYFGLYQKAFLKAFQGIDPDTGSRRADGEMFYKTPPLARGDERIRFGTEDVGFPDEQVGYYISETNQTEAGLSVHNTKSIPNRYNLMGTAAWQQAKKFYMKEDSRITPEHIEKYMYPIHVYSQTSPDNKNPDKIYTFWRMPMPGSEEFYLKETNRWADYKDPNEYKDRPPFIVDPSKTVLENLQEALTLNTKFTREVTGVLGMAAIQPIHFLLGVTGKISDAGDWIYQKASDDPNAQIEWLNSVLKPIPEAELQAIDEITTAGGYGRPWAVSEFYKNKHRANAYQALLDYAREMHQPLYLGLIEGPPSNPPYESSQYTKNKGKFRYDLFKSYYENTWVKNNPELHDEFLNLLDQKIAEEASATP